MNSINFPGVKSHPRVSKANKKGVISQWKITRKNVFNCMPKVQYTKMDSSLPSLSESTSPFSWCWKTTFLLLKYGIAFGEACCLKIQKCKSLIMRLTGRVPRLVPSGGQWWPSRLQGAADPPVLYHAHLGAYGHSVTRWAVPPARLNCSPLSLWVC